MADKVITNLDSSKASGPDCIPVVVLRNCELNSSITVSRNLSFLIVGRFHWWSLYLRMLKNDLQLKTTTLIVFFLWLVKSLKNLKIRGFVGHLKKCGPFSDFQYGFRSSQSTADLLTAVSDRIARAFARAFDRCEATRGLARDISKAFDRVWRVVLLNKRMAFQVRNLALFLLSSVIDGFSWFWMVSVHWSSSRLHSWSYTFPTIH